MYDILIKNGLIIDGSGTPPYQGNLAIKDGLIKLTKEEPEAGRVIDARGRYVTPGFIDTH